MKIAIPTADYPPIEGGIATLTLQISRELARLGHEVTVIAPGFGGMDRFDADEPLRVVRYRGYALGWLRYFPMERAARPWLNDADCVLAINVAYAGLMAKRRKRPYVVMAYGYEFLKFGRNPIMKRVLLSVYGSAHRIVAISSFTRNALVAFGVEPDRIEVILPGAPSPANQSEARVASVRAKYGIDSSPIILAVGRFIARKGQETLIDALQAVLAEFPSVKLVLAGRGPRLDAARRMAVERGVGANVIFTGRVSDEELAALYQCCDVFALPAGEEPGGHVEGFGLVYAEAQAYGKPVIAGRSGGTLDAVIDEKTGLLIEAGNPSAASTALLRLLNDPQLARSLGEAGRRRVEAELNWESFTRRLAHVLERGA